MLNRWLIRRFVGPGSPEEDPALRHRFGLLEGWSGVLVNALLFLVKGGLWLASGSIALLADAIHTLADMATSLVVIYGFRLAGKPSDEEHPFGHGRAEAVATLIVAVLLIVAGVEFFRSSVERLAHPVVLNVSWTMVGILAATLVLKEWLARFSRQLARMIGSDALEADFWHHRTDSIATVLVIAGFVLSRYDLQWVDPIAGIGVSIIVAWTGFDIGRRAVSGLLGEAPTEEEVEAIRQQAMQVEGVKGVHDVIVHKYGDMRIISLHIEVSSNLDPLTLHGISDEVERRVSGDRHGTVVVHVDPLNENHPEYERIKKVVEEVVGGDPRCHSFHDLRLVGRGDDLHILFDVALWKPLSDAERRSLQADLLKRLKEKLPKIRAVFQMEPVYHRRSLRAGEGS
jgi:cation diffusion facilitator family transporter